MSSHYINLFCPFPDCTASESIYTGDVYLNDFPDTGPDSFEGESISTPCNEHAGMDLPAADQTPATDSERDERLRGIQERVDAALEGPWEAVSIHHRPEGSLDHDCWDVESADEMGAFLRCIREDELDAQETATFIAAARADVPWLLDEVRHLLARLAEQAAIIERVQSEVDRWEALPGATESAVYFRKTLGDRIRTALGSQRTEGQG